MSYDLIKVRSRQIIYKKIKIRQLAWASSGAKPEWARVFKIESQSKDWILSRSEQSQSQPEHSELDCDLETEFLLDQSKARIRQATQSSIRIRKLVFCEI